VRVIRAARKNGRVRVTAILSKGETDAFRDRQTYLTVAENPNGTLSVRTQWFRRDAGEKPQSQRDTPAVEA